MSVSKSEENILPYSVPSNPGRSEVEPRRNSYRTEGIVFMGEFVGTFMFLFLSFAGTQIAAQSATAQALLPESASALPEVSKLLYISLAFGISLAINVAIFADISGAMFNPAVTIGLWIVGLVRWNRAVHSIFAQLAGGICAAAVVDALLPGPLPVATTLTPSISTSRGLFLEMFMTAQLLLTVLAVPASAAKPMYVGLTLFIAEICSVYYTGGSLNPARSLGPATIVGFVGYHWIYWLGPIMGAGLGAGTYMLVKLVQGERARQAADEA